MVVFVLVEIEVVKVVAMAGKMIRDDEKKGGGKVMAVVMGNL